ncbi:MAG: response regulator transcription factor [Candidatus Latescibacterota bacterium]|nr:MAG: response regulator transcription factor [Candidatus Latescibacterota bacterium]
MSQEIMAFLDDIFYTAKIREIAKAHAKDVRFVRDLAGLDKRLAAAAPQTVLVDLTAETLQPLELIRRIKEQPEWAHVRVVAYSSHAQAELMEEASRLGADEVLSKSDLTPKLAEIVASTSI